ncbi:hypothetical protein CC78DRAFT_523948 [Lojkania enalia]|uniref:DUF7025 domain-containing protein n=1 Tax=Lojkania enalia TaxID=147567 RepID=A0A9P4N5W9_9PLEO|nr:hypothetical protein CC78DRAFT_523948 [Didymosphaeria enalia]
MTPDVPIIAHGEIVIQSPCLIKALTEDILKGYPGLSHELSKFESRAPFQPFVHRWGDPLKFMKRRNLDETTRMHTIILYKMLEGELLDTVGVFKQHILNRDITFDHAWMIFQPGCIVVSSSKLDLAAFELQRAEYGENQHGKILRLHCECLDWNGIQYCRGLLNIDLLGFDGTRKINTLEVFPMELSDDKGQIKHQLMKKGERFESLVHHQYQDYSGPAITRDKNGCEQEIQVLERIIIDAKSFNQLSPHCSRRWKRMSARDYDMLVTSRATQTAMKKLRVNVKGGPVINLGIYHHLICRSTMRGYSIKLKRWLEFFVSNVTDTFQNASTVDDVVFSGEMEDLISSFTRLEHIGMSIHILGHQIMSKGITAETVSNRIGIPLLTISPDDLGTSLLQTELHLCEVLDLVHRWNTLLLLDAFDFLLEEGSNYGFGLDNVLDIIVHYLNNHDYKGPFFISTNREDDVYKVLLLASDN